MGKHHKWTEEQNEVIREAIKEKTSPFELVGHPKLKDLTREQIRGKYQRVKDDMNKADILTPRGNQFIFEAE